MSYFTAVLVRDGKSWLARDVDVEEFDALGDLAAALKALGGDDEPVLALIEREDAWWAVVRIEGDEDPRVFVSDVAGVVASRFAELLEVEADDDAPVGSGTYGGDVDLLADLGTSPEGLQQLCDEGVVPMDALASLAEAAGFPEELDSLR